MREPPPFYVLGYSEAAMLLRGRDAPDIAAALCIHGQRDPVLELSCPLRVDLTFDDCPMVGDDPVSQYAERLRRRKAAEIGLKLRPPNEDHVHAILEFAERAQNSDRTVLFQCHAGISRSAAAALIALAIWLGPGMERQAVQTLREVRPAAAPPLDLIACADRMLGRAGLLTESLAIQ